MVNGAASEWIPIVSGVPQGSVLGPLLFILHTSKMFELVENKLFAYADDSTLLAVVLKPAHLGVKFDSKLTFGDDACGIWFPVPLRIGILSLVKRIFVDTSLLLRCYFAFVFPILEYCYPVWGSAARNVIFSS